MSQLAPLVAFILLSGTACVAAPTGPAQAAQGMDRLSAYDTIDACLYRHTTADARGACVGEYSRACQNLTPDGDTTAGMVRCAGEEYEAWDVWLNDAYREVRVGLSEASTLALREAQRSWIAGRDQDCEFLASLYGGGTMGRTERAQCLMDETAKRAIQLMDWDENWPPF